jgi:RHS repeat-associated protein
MNMSLHDTRFSTSTKYLIFAKNQFKANLRLFHVIHGKQIFSRRVLLTLVFLIFVATFLCPQARANHTADYRVIYLEDPYVQQGWCELLNLPGYPIVQGFTALVNYCQPQLIPYLNQGWTSSGWACAFYGTAYNCLNTITNPNFLPDTANMLASCFNEQPPPTLDPAYPDWCLIPYPIVCPTGQTLNLQTGLCIALGDRNAGKPTNCQCVGDPINPGSGNVYWEVTDFRSNGAYPLEFKYSYNSVIANESNNPGQASTNENMGIGWTTNTGAHLFINQYSPDVLTTPCVVNGVDYVCPAIYVDNGTYTIENTVWHADGSQSKFTYQVINNALPTPGTYFNAEAGTAAELIYVNLPQPLTGAGYEFIRTDGYAEFYDSNGNLLAKENPQGLMQTYQYTGTLLTSITDPFGRTLQFTYDSSNRIHTMTNPAGRLYTYGYDSYGNLTSVTYPDNSVVQYLYTYPSFPNALTGIIDENGNQYATWSYYPDGRVNTSVNGTTGTNGINANPFSIVYNSDGSADVTEPSGNNPSGEVRHMTFTTVNYANLLSSNSGPCTQCGDKSQSISYDSNGHISSTTDFNGNVTQYSYDSAGRILSETDAYGTPVARTTTTQWDTTRNLPDLITEPGRTISYNRQPSIWTTTVTDTATRVNRTTTYNYNSAGLLTSITDPLGHVTSFTYDNQGHGNITTITNALGQVTQIPLYDANGYPKTIIDPNGVTTTLTYDLRQRLWNRTVGNAETQFGYDPAGNLTQVTLPTGAYLQYSYDSAHRLISINDTINGNHSDIINYTLDNLGNRIAENTYDPNGVLRRTLARTYDTLNHLQTITGGVGQVTHYTEDLNGNTIGITDPMNNPYTQGFDALNRLVSVLDPYSHTTGYTYDALDRVTQVSDPRSLATQYSNDGFNDLTQLISPDTGTSTYTYDLDGDRLCQTDARHIHTQYGYDALNRLTAIGYPVFIPGGLPAACGGDIGGGPRPNVTFTYDQGTNGIGHLTSVTDDTGTTSYTYNSRGDVTQKSDLIASYAFTVSYGYDTADNLTSITYPDGMVVSYTRDSNERITTVTKGSTTVASSITYEPFGPVTGFTYGNGLAETRIYDQNYRLTGITTLPGIQNWTLGYNLDDDITGITDNLVSSNSQTLHYDNLNRLDTANGAYGNLSYGFDNNGNRISETLNSTGTVFTVATTSNQLLSLSGGQTATYSYDADGNITSDGTHTYSYDDSGRLTQVDSNTATYQYNGLGQRVEKTAGGVTTVFVYDEAGHLLGEYTPTGTLIAEHIWLNDRPIGVKTSTGMYYVHADPLGAPRYITNSSKTVVWQWNSGPFGNGAPTGSLTYNLRFPGQYYDAETGKNYNYFRDYDPTIGRYIESDPIGLLGLKKKADQLSKLYWYMSTGEMSDKPIPFALPFLNPYAYSNQNPINNYDSRGEFPAVLIVVPAIIIGGAIFADLYAQIKCEQHCAAPGGVCPIKRTGNPDVDQQLYANEVLECQSKCAGAFSALLHGLL